jgi:deoxyribonuclease V
LLDYKKAVKIQENFIKGLRLSPLNFDKIKKIAGVDCSYKNGKAIAAIVILSFPSLEIIERVFSSVRVTFPYIPGLLSFRELPAITKTYKKLKNIPDLLFVDGHGIIHPRKIGIATHLGLILKKPTMGIAKKKFVSTFKKLPVNIGDYEKIYVDSEFRGYVYKSKKNCNPIYISPGNLISIEQSLEFTLKCMGKYKLPLPTHYAHNYSEEVKKYV